MGIQSEYLTWADDEGRQKVMTSYGAALLKSTPVVRSHATDIYMDVAPYGVHVRDEFNRGDYNYLRPGEALPKTSKGIIQACMQSYDHIGVVRNIIDMMSDFASKGIDLAHRNRRTEKFYKEWFRRTNGSERSERFLNTLFRAGNVIVRRHTGILSENDVTRLRRSIAKPDEKMPGEPNVAKGEIPVRYSFFDPTTIELYGEGLSVFVGRPNYRFGLNIPESIIKAVNWPKNAIEEELVNKLPPALVKSIRAGERLIPLDSDKVSAFYYKKDDWEPWAKPMVHSILGDLKALQKMKLADIAALDGIISSIRLWKLGSLEHKTIPDESVMAKLSEMLTNNVAGGIMDLVWGPDIELMETSTEAYKFLGESKYAPTLKAIYDGLGIPTALTDSQNKSAFSNNYFSLRVLTERLEYGRMVLKEFWENEVRLVQKAMGFRFPAQVVFDDLLTDEQAQTTLTLALLDRDIISPETARDILGFEPDVEDIRVRRAYRKRERGGDPPKASPFHNPNGKMELLKLFAGSGGYPPSDFDLELGDDDSPNDLLPKTQTAPPKKDNKGRPPGSTDKTKRKRKKVKPRQPALSVLEDLTKAEQAYESLTTILSGPFLASVGKKNFRQVSETDQAKFDQLRLACLCQACGGPVTKEDVQRLLASELAVDPGVHRLIQQAAADWTTTHGSTPPAEVMRRLHIGAVAVLKGKNANAHDSDDGLSPLS